MTNNYAVGYVTTEVGLNEQLFIPQGTEVYVYGRIAKPEFNNKYGFIIYIPTIKEAIVIDVSLIGFPAPQIPFIGEDLPQEVLEKIEGEESYEEILGDTIGETMLEQEEVGTLLIPDSFNFIIGDYTEDTYEANKIDGYEQYEVTWVENNKLHMELYDTEEVYENIKEGIWVIVE